MDKKEYSNGEITVVWKADLCIHSGNCVKGLPNVFKPEEKPWIQLESTTTEQLANQINKCPSGALSYYKKEKPQKETPVAQTKVELIENGPLVVHGPLVVKAGDTESLRTTPRTSFCRCGASSNKPFCDGSHKTRG